MIRGIGVVGAIALAVMTAVPAQAQIAGARELVAGEVATGAPASAARPDIYYFVGEAGAKLTFALSSNAETRLVLYEPTGEEMLTAGGGGVTLEAVLPFTEVYTLAVIRRNAAQPYTLFMTATLPTLGEAMLAYGIGYDESDGERRRRCWINPGVSYRSILPDAPPDEAQSAEATLGSDRETHSLAFRRQDGSNSNIRHRYRIEGTEIIRSMERSDGREGPELRSAFTPEIFGMAAFGSALRFTGYHCDP